MFMQIIKGTIKLVFNNQTVSLNRVSSVLFRNAALFKLYAREKARDCFETCSMLYTNALKKLTLELVNAFIALECYLSELCNDTKHIKNKAEKKAANARFNAALKCHPTYPDYLEKRKNKKRKAA